MKQFARPSMKMIHLRFVEKKLAIAKRYSEAVSQRKIGDHQQAIEEEAIQKNLESQMKGDYQKMRDKHKAEIERIENHYDSMNDDLEAKMKKELNLIRFAMKQNIEIKPLDARRQKWKVASSGQLKSHQSLIPTPRTKQKFEQYKFDHYQAAQFKVTPFDDETLSKLPVASFRSQKHQPAQSGRTTARSQSSLSSRSKFPALKHT